MPPKTNQLQPRGLIQTIVPLAKTQQFYWYVGHVLTVLLFVFNQISSFIAPARSEALYRWALLAVLATYAIVVRQIHFRGGLGQIVSKATSPGFLRDDNVQYLGLALVLYLSSFKIGAVAGTLYSFAIFSVFHALTYFQNNLLHALPLPIERQQALNTRINDFTTNSNQQALLIAANAELFTPLSFVLQLPALVFRIFRDPVYVIVDVLTLATIVVFLKLRFNQNKYTQTVVQQLDLRISAFVSNPLLPLQAQLFGIYAAFRNALVTYIGPIRISAGATAKKTS